MALFGRKDINQGVEEWKKTRGAVLLDVRTREEYQDQNIEGSVNLPLDELDKTPEQIPDPDTPIFVYCRSGARSETAEKILKRAGYHKAVNIGGILSYRGKTK